MSSASGSAATASPDCPVPSPPGPSQRRLHLRQSPDQPPARRPLPRRTLSSALPDSDSTFRIRSCTIRPLSAVENLTSEWTDVGNLDVRVGDAVPRAHRVVASPAGPGRPLRPVPRRQGLAQHPHPPPAGLLGQVRSPAPRGETTPPTRPDRARRAAADGSLPPSPRPAAARSRSRGAPRCPARSPAATWCRPTRETNPAPTRPTALGCAPARPVRSRPPAPAPRTCGSSCDPPRGWPPARAATDPHTNEPESR